PDAPLSGTLDLPFTLLDAPARLDAVLGGSLEAPSASLEVVGAGLAAIGTGTLSAAEATLTITEPAITRLLPDVAAQFAGLGVSPVTADAHWTADSGWTLVANSQVGSPPPAGVAGADSPPAAPGPRLGLELALAGTGATYSGGLDLRLDGERVANVAVAGVGADLAADLDLAAVQWDSIAERFGVEADVVGGGHARFTTAPLDASLQVDMSGTAGGLALTLSGTAPNDLGFTVTGETQAAGNVDLTGRLAWDQEQKAVVTGRLGDHQVDASLTLDDALTAGRLLVDVPGARLTADLTTPASNDPAAGAATTGPRRDVQ